MYLQVASELVTKFKHEIDSYLDLVVNTTENELGRCGPLANVYKSVVEASCSRIVNPLVSFIHIFIGSVPKTEYENIQRIIIIIKHFFSSVFVEWIMGRNRSVHFAIFASNNT